MMRLFLGLPVPLEVAHLLVERTAQAPARLNRARLPLAEDLHLTLRFFGAVDESRVGDMQRALDTLHQPAFPLTLVGVDAFRSVGAIFAALAPSLELAALAEALNEALAWRGFARDLRPFHPHVTLARVRRAVPQAELARWSGVWAPIVFVADQLVLFQAPDSRATTETEAANPPAPPQDSLAGGVRYNRLYTLPLTSAKREAGARPQPTP